MNELTQKQRRVLAFLYQHSVQHGYPPSIREIGVHFRISTLRGVTVHLDALQRKACIVRCSSARAIRITAEGRAALGLADAQPCPPGELAIAGVVRRLRHESALHSEKAAMLDETKIGAIKRLRYTAGILASLADEFETGDRRPTASQSVLGANQAP